MNLTKRNHYNPCFWTALWNPEYFASVRAGVRPKRPARRHMVHSLCLKAAKVIATVVDNVHYDSNLGLADMTPQSIKDFCKRRAPEDFGEISRCLEQNPETVTMDFEAILQGLENLHGHQNIIEAARLGDFSSVKHKGFVTGLLHIQAMRSHEFMQLMISGAEASGIPKWEYFWLLKRAWSNRLVLARAVSPLAMSRWTLYRTTKDRFPLCDSPVMIGRDGLMLALSPRLLLEIDLNVRATEDQWIVRDGVPESKFREFRRRTIQNAFKDIIFSDPVELHGWLALGECRARIRRLDKKEGYRAAIREAAARVGWGVYGFGRVPDDFESWIGPILDASTAPKPSAS